MRSKNRSVKAQGRRRRVVRAVLTTLGMLLAISGGKAFAQERPQAAWPDKPLRLVVGFAPGGGTDVMARILAQSLSEALAQTVIVDNKPGASGNIAVAEVARAAPNGQTFLVAPTSAATVNPLLFKSSALVSRDLVAVGSIGRTQTYLLGRPTLEVRDARDLAEIARVRPGTISYGSAGAGTAPHLACEMFRVAAGVDSMHVPYRGSAPALQDLMAGQIDFLCDPGIAFSHIRSGKVRLLGIVGSERSPFFPQAPTLAESGFADAVLDIWFGVWAPKGTAAAVTERMNREIAKALSEPGLQSRYAEIGAEARAMDGERFEQLLAAESERLSRLIGEQNIVAE
jgi:tripartite-type tricarboxylate transporter receptor subunit TctC